MDIPRLVIPIPSPLTDDSSAVSEVRVARLVKWHKEQGADGFMVGSDMGEYQSLAISERAKLLEYANREALGMPVYVNVTGDTTNASMAIAQEADEWGCAGAVLMPPVAYHLSEEEASYFVKAVRRHGQVPCGFIDPRGKHKKLSAEDTSGVVVPRLLADKGLEEFALTQGSSHECWTPAGMVHPVGVFGARRAKKLLSMWNQTKSLVDALFKVGGPHRVAKYVTNHLEIEVGNPRPPLAPLSGQATDLADKIIKLTDGV